MISKINSQASMPITMKQAKKEVVEESDVKAKGYVSNPNSNQGTVALNSYGKALFNISNDLNIQPVKPVDCTNLEEIKGERIYDSNNQLKFIKEESDDYITNYYISDDNSNHINYIEKIDKKTNKPIFTQHCEQEDGKCIETYVTKFNSETGKEEAFTCYENGKIVYSGKNSVNKNGEEIFISKNYDGHGYSISLESPNNNGRKYFHISEDKKNIRYTEQKETPRGTIEKNVEFYNGLPFVLEESKRTALPNLIALEPLLDSDLQPAEKFDFNAWEEKINNAEGQETRFSNGNYETKKVVIDGEEVLAYYDFNNKLEKIKTQSMEIKKNKNSIFIKENLGSGKEKETEFSKNTIMIRHNDNGFEKTLHVDIKTKKPTFYSEKEINDSEKKHCKTYVFNKQGLVDDIFEY